MVYGVIFIKKLLIFEFCNNSISFYAVDWQLSFVKRSVIQRSCVRNSVWTDHKGRFCVLRFECSPATLYELSTAVSTELCFHLNPIRLIDIKFMLMSKLQKSASFVLFFISNSPDFMTSIRENMFSWFSLNFSRIARQISLKNQQRFKAVTLKQSSKIKVDGKKLSSSLATRYSFANFHVTFDIGRSKWHLAKTHMRQTQMFKHMVNSS